MTFLTFSFQKPTLSELEIESNRNGQFWKFLSLYFKHCTKCQFFMVKTKKSYTCEDGGAHLRISVWHLLMNLRNNYLLKKLLK